MTITSSVKDVTYIALSPINYDNRDSDFFLKVNSTVFIHQFSKILLPDNSLIRMPSLEFKETLKESIPIMKYHKIYDFDVINLKYNRENTTGKTCANIYMGDKYRIRYISTSYEDFTYWYIPEIYFQKNTTDYSNRHFLYILYDVTYLDFVSAFTRNGVLVSGGISTKDYSLYSGKKDKTILFKYLQVVFGYDFWIHISS